MFGPDEIKTAITKDLNTDIAIPDGHKGGLVTFVNDDKIEIAVAEKINEHWSVELVGSHSWVGNNEIGAISKITW